MIEYCDVFFFFPLPNHFLGCIMPHVINVVPNMPIFSYLGKILSSVMSYPNFSPPYPFVGPNTQT